MLLFLVCLFFVVSPSPSPTLKAVREKFGPEDRTGSEPAVNNKLGKKLTLISRESDSSGHLASSPL